MGYAQLLPLALGVALAPQARAFYGGRGIVPLGTDRETKRTNESALLE